MISLHSLVGREARLPAEAELGSPPKGNTTHRLPEYIDKLRRSLQEVHQLAFGQSEKAHLRNKHLYDRTTLERKYSPGEDVYLFRKLVKKGEYHKFVRPWRAAKILTRVGDMNYRIKVEGSRKVLVVHHNRLKPRRGDVCENFVKINLCGGITGSIVDLIQKC